MASDNALFVFGQFAHLRVDQPSHITVCDLLNAIKASRLDLLEAAGDLPGLCAPSLWKDERVVAAMAIASPACNQLYVRILNKTQ
jgi:hypothetical protein